MDSENTQKGIRWSYLEVLKGKATVIVAVELVLAAVLLFVLFVLSKDATKLGTLVASLLSDLLTLKANAFALDFCSTVVYLIPVMAVGYFIIAGLLTIVYNVMDRNLLRTPENLEAHRVFAEPAWAWPLSFVVGIFDFSASFVLLNSAFSALGGSSLSAAAQGLWVIVFTTACLVFAERRVTRVSRSMADRFKGNRELVGDLLGGALDDYLPERCRTDLGRAKVATIVAKGISSSRLVAPLVVRGLDARSKVLVFSGFLTATIHGIATALTFGIANTATISVIVAGVQFGAGRGDEYMQSLREVAGEKPHFLIEALSVVICIVATHLSGFGYLA